MHGILRLVVFCRLARVESEKLLSDQRAADLEVLLDKERADREAITSSFRGELRSSQQVAPPSMPASSQFKPKIG